MRYDPGRFASGTILVAAPVSSHSFRTNGAHDALSGVAVVPLGSRAQTKLQRIRSPLRLARLALAAARHSGLAKSARQKVEC
jgi:hypothetical protein